MSSALKDKQPLRGGNSSAPSDKWWKDVVCYQVWPMSFNDSNGDGQGDIQGIIQKLDYLKDLGIDVIWVSPTYKSPMQDYGYDVTDWQDMNPKLGTLKDMETLINKAHGLGMRILLDLVVTHTSDHHAWFAESRMSTNNPKSDWYVWRKPRPGNMVHNTRTDTYEKVEEPTNWRACFGGSTWEYAAERDEYYLHLFMVGEPDLNWEKQEVRTAIYDKAIGFWLERGVDGFRIDTANRLSKDQKFPDAETKMPGVLQPGSKQVINGPRSHEFLKEMRRYMDNHPSVKGSGRELMLVGELPLTEYDDFLKYVHPAEKELSMTFDFDMIKLGGHDTPDEVKPHEVKNFSDNDPSFTLKRFKEELGKVQKVIAEGAWGTVFMECHDQPRSVTRYTTPDPQFYNKAAKLLCLMQTTLSGTQFVYQGQEIGMTNMPQDWGYDDFRDVGAKAYMDTERAINGEKGWENARYGNLNWGRDNCRTPVQWSNDRNAGFSSTKGDTWIKVNGNFKKGVNVEDQKKDNESIWNFWRKQIALRKKYKSVFMHGAFEILDLENPKTFTYVKTAKDGTTALVCLNFSSEEQPICFPPDARKKYLVSANQEPVLMSPTHLGPWEGRLYWVEVAPKALGFDLPKSDILNIIQTHGFPGYTSNPEPPSAKVDVKPGKSVTMTSKTNATSRQSTVK